MERTEHETRSNNGDLKDLKEVATAKIEDAREWSADVLDQVETFVRQRPGTAVLVALGAGFLIGRLIRRA